MIGDRTKIGLDSLLFFKSVASVLLIFFCFMCYFFTAVSARTGATPWSSQVDFQSLIYGSSSTNDVVRVMGAPPDEIVRSQQMYPVIENFYYYDEEKSEAATVFVFESGFLVGMHLKTPDNQLVDFTYFLANNGDRQLMNPILGDYLPYFFYPRFTTTPW